MSGLQAHLPDLAALSAGKRRLLIQRLREQQRGNGTGRITPRPRDQNPLPVSYSQQRLWFLDQMEPGTPAYNIPVAVRLVGPLDVPALRRSLNEVVRRHEGLRTTFAAVAGQPVQVIAPNLTLDLPLISLEGVPAAHREDETLRRVNAEAGRSFDLSAGPLVRAALLRLEDEHHALLLTMHHIVSDGWSMGVFFRELCALYAAFRAGAPSPLPRLPIQYADFALWQREWLRGEVLEGHLAYWKRQLGGAPASLNPPADCPRPPVQSFRGATHTFTVPGTVARGLRALSRREDATLFMIMLAALNALLCRYTGQQDILVGSFIANRNRPETEGLIGFFVNTVVLRTDLSGNPTFRELLARVRDLTLGAYDHQDLPLEMVIEALQPARDPGRTPLFQVMIVVQEGMPALSLPGVNATHLPTTRGRSEFDLSLWVTDDGGELEATLAYSTDLFAAETIARMAGHLQVLLAAVVADPELRLWDLPLLSAEERGRIMVAWNDTGRDHPGRCIHELFEARAARAPEAVAVVGDGRRLTYGALNRHASRLARQLRARGVGPEVVVGVCLEKSLELVVAVLGVLKAGGAYLALDPGYPRDRLALMLEDGGVSVLLTRGALATGPLAGATGAASVVLVDDLLQPEGLEVSGRADGAGDDVNVAGGATAANLAYVVYTSGSTGRPKGVMVTHGGLANAYHAMAEAYRLEAAATCHLQMASASFDVFSGDLVRALCSGGRLVLCPKETLLAPDALYRLMVAEGVDCGDFVPAVLRGLVGYLEETRQSLDFMRLVVAGADIWYLREHEATRRLCGRGTLLYNTYGVSEATIDNTRFDTTGLALPQDGVAPIGRPIVNTRVYILDRWLGPVPAGVPGELYIGGAGVARGYLGRPDLTAGRFIPDPWSGEPGGRLYRTGDLVRYLADGNIEFLGRADDQIKIRGFRIEPGEVEAALQGHPAVREALVMAREDKPGDRRLVAYVVAKDGAAGEAQPGELRQFVAQRLPAYMVPAAIVPLPALPLLPSGKVDRRALPAPDAAAYDAWASAVGPRTPVEEVLAAIWAEVLGVERVGVHDNFFELGGHSLLATRVVSRAREVLAVELPLRAFFEGPTVAELAGAVERLRREGRGAVVPPITRAAPAAPAAPAGGIMPLSFAQQRLWYLDCLEPGNPAYNVTVAATLAGALDTAALGRGINEVVKRHDVLRATFTSVDGEPVQVIAPALTVDVPLLDLGGLSPAAREEETRRLIAEQANRPFSLSRGPLLRAALLRHEPERHVLLLTMHHIISDGWSMGVFHGELAHAYEAFCAGRPAPLPELPIQYADYASWQRQWLQGEVLESQLAYWRRQLEAAPADLGLPADRPRPALRTSSGATAGLALPVAVTGGLKALGRREGVTLFMAMLAAFTVLLHRYTGSDDVIVGAPVANRSRPETAGLIGFLVNTLALRTDLSGNPTFRQLLARIRETALGAYDHQEVPFEKVVEAVHPVRDPGRTPLIQVMFDLQNQQGPPLSMPGLCVSPVEVRGKTAKFDLTLTVSDTGEGYLALWEYSTDLFEAETIWRMAGHFQALLAAVVADPGRRLQDLPLLSGDERRRFLVEWNATERHCPAALVHELFEAQAARVPEAVAVAGDGAHLTYRELNRRANRLARHLRALGVGPEVLVGVCLERSPELVVAVLAVLKAGGAYLAVDPDYPRERLALMLEDSGVSVLLTREEMAAGLLAGATGNAAVVALDEVQRGAWPGEGQGAGADDDVNARSGATAAKLAYVVYTSGSTGRPKGVMVTHGGLANTYYAWAATCGDDAPARYLQMASPSFDVFSGDLVRALCSGGCLVLCPREALLAPDALYDLMVTQGVDCGDFVPVVLGHLAQYLEETGQSLSFLRTLVVGSDVWRLEEYDAARRLCGPKTRIINYYGVSEATIDSTSFTDGATGLAAGGITPIGRPIANTRVYITDRGLGLVPVGVPGEILIGGAGLARGYLGRPDLTAEAFIPDPWSGAAGARLYRTGDRGRFLPDGNIEFLGRVDGQIKMRGFRIEPGEVESVLRCHPAVEQALVVACEAEPGDKRLVAYVVPRTEAAGAPQAAAPQMAGLRQFAAERLPAYMVPAAIVPLPALPLLPSGKVDRRALPAPEQVRAAMGGGFVAPRTPVEEALAGIWAEVLRVDRVGVHDNFFELGGDSILSIQVVARARSAGLRIGLREFLQQQTVAGLAAVVGRSAPPDAEQGPVTGPLPLTPVQRAFFEQGLPDPHHLSWAVLLEEREPLRPELLERALQGLLAHHDALRLRFTRDATGWRQEIAPPLEAIALTRVDLSALPGARRRPALEAAAATLQAGLDLARGPIVRAALFNVGAPTPKRLLLIIHHLAVDGVSWRILIEDLETAYRQLSAGGPIELGPKTTSFKCWALRLASHAGSPEVKEELAFWLGQAPPPGSRLPLDCPRGSNTIASAATVLAYLDRAETTALLRGIPRACGARVNDVLLTALMQALSDWAPGPALLVHLEGHGREPLFDDVDLSRTVGWFTAGFPVLLGPAGALQSIKEQLGHVPRHGIGYGLLRYMGGDEQVAGKLRAVGQAEVSLNYLGQFDQVFSATSLFRPALEGRVLYLRMRGHREHLIDVNAAVRGGRLIMEWSFSRNLHRAGTVERLASGFTAALRSLIARIPSPGGQ